MPRLQRFTLAHWVDPAAAFVALYSTETDVVWLDSGPSAATGRSYLGRAAHTLTSPAAADLATLRPALAANPVDGTHGFALGWVGWIGYETRFETTGSPRNRSAPYPDLAFLYLDRAIEFDHETRTVTLVSLQEDESWRSEIVQAIATLAKGSAPTVTTPPAAATKIATRAAQWRDNDEAYLENIRACQARIAAGDAYLLCLTNAARVPGSFDPLSTYLALRASSPTHHGALLRIGDISLLSASPERFLSVSPAGEIESRPIKGTRPRGASAAQDEEFARSLATSEKERAENLMIVDLMRNDIGRVSDVGTVEVPELLVVESYAQVHQLVSTVRGRRAAGLDAIDVVRACFPAGSMTGAPKASAIRILDELEGAPRGIYSGVFGYFGLDGRIDLAMVIRSIVLDSTGASVGSGGGITGLSDPDEELAEVKLKAAALLRALGAS